MIPLELMLEDASIKLSAVVSSLKTVSARAMLAEMIDGERDPQKLAALAKGKLRGKIPQLSEALTGSFDDHHARLARSILHRLELVETALAELDGVLEQACLPWAHQIELLQTIPGVGVKVAQVFIAETGGDMSRFPSAAHLAAWAGLAPAIYESAGKRRTGWGAAQEQVAQPHAGRVGRVGRADARQEPPRRPARPADQTARDGPGASRGRPLDPGRGLLDAQTR